MGFGGGGGGPVVAFRFRGRWSDCGWWVLFAVVVGFFAACGYGFVIGIWLDLLGFILCCAFWVMEWRMRWL